MSLDLFRLAELERRLANMIRMGTIDQVDFARHRVRVKCGDILTDWIPAPADIGHNYRRWLPVRTGTQVVLASPAGELAQARIVSHLYTEALAAPSAEKQLDMIAFNDGTRIHYDSKARALSIKVTGSVAVSAPHISIDGEAGDIMVNGISLVNHVHPQNNGNDTGGGVDTGAAQ